MVIGILNLCCPDSLFSVTLVKDREELFTEHGLKAPNRQNQHQNQKKTQQKRGKNKANNSTQITTLGSSRWDKCQDGCFLKVPALFQTVSSCTFRDVLCTKPSGMSGESWLTGTKGESTSRRKISSRCNVLFFSYGGTNSSKGRKQKKSFQSKATVSSTTQNELGILG